MQAISARVHGYIDCVMVGVFALAPLVLGFAGGPAYFCWGLAAVLFLVSLATDYPLGVSKALPLAVHGVVEAVMTVLLLAMPWSAGFGTSVITRTFFLVTGAAYMFIWLLSDYREIERPSRRDVTIERPAS